MVLRASSPTIWGTSALGFPKLLQFPRSKPESPGVPKPKPPYSHRPLSSSFLELPYRILNINYKRELLRSLWVTVNPQGIMLKSKERAVRLHKAGEHVENLGFSPQRLGKSGEIKC